MTPVLNFSKIAVTLADRSSYDHKSNAKRIDSRSLSLNNGLMSSPWLTGAPGFEMPALTCQLTYQDACGGQGLGSRMRGKRRTHTRCAQVRAWHDLYALIIKTAPAGRTSREAPRQSRHRVRAILAPPPQGRARREPAGRPDRAAG